MYKKLWFIYLFVFLLSFVSCDKDDDIDPAKESVANITFKKIMPLSLFAAANTISVSPNEQYMIFSYKENTSFKDYYSNDGGETAHELNINRTVYNRNRPIEANISNGGLFVFEGGLFNLSNTGSGAVSYATGVTTSGKLVYIQNEGSNGKTFFLFNNGAYESTGVRLTIDERYYLGTSGEKLGFFDHTSRSIAEFDVTNQTYTQTTLDLDYGRIGGFGQYTGEIQTAYSHGYFAYAKSGGLLMISPDHEVTYYTYPAMGASYHNTVKLRLFRNRAYVELIDGNTYEAYNGELKLVEMNFPIERVEGNIYTQGFLENSDRWKSGIIKTSGSNQEYLPLDLPYEHLGSRRFTTVQVVGDHAYVGNKVYSLNSNSYATSPIGEVISVYYDDTKTIAYTSTGTYTSINGKDWIEQSTDQPRPNLVTKDAQGLYHALSKQLKVYVSPSTQARTYSVDLKGYVSNDGIHWELVPATVKNRAGVGPNLLSSDGVIIFRDTNPGINSLIYLSEDYGANYEHFLNGVSTLDNEPLPDGFRASDFETSSGKFISANVGDNGSRLTIAVCKTAKGECEELEIPTEFGVDGLNDNSITSTMTENDELVFNTLVGIYISSRLQ